MPVRPMSMDHSSGALTSVWTKISVARGIGQHVLLSNLHATNALHVSFNGGRNYHVIRAGDPPLDVHALFHYFFLRGGAVGPDAELAAVDVATAAALPAYVQAGAGAGATLTASAPGVLTVDGVATVLGDRILVKDGAAGSDNGIYEVTTEGTVGVAFVLTRATDHDTDAEVTSGDSVSVERGTVNGGRVFQITTADPITVDTTAVTWAEVTGSYNVLVGAG